MDGAALTPDEVLEMQTRLASWVEEIPSARGKTRSELFAKFDNTRLPIASVPPEYLGAFNGTAEDNRVYCGKAYFLDHARQGKIVLHKSLFSHKKNPVPESASRTGCFIWGRPIPNRSCCRGNTRRKPFRS
jgi:hypothetical protein